MKYCIVDAGYKTPATAKLLLDDGVTSVFPYKRPMIKEGYFKKHEYVYDDYNDAYLCVHELKKLARCKKEWGLQMA